MISGKNGRNGNGRRTDTDHFLAHQIFLPDGTPYGPNGLRGEFHGLNGRQAAGVLQDSTAAVPIDFRAFEDGTLADIVRDPGNPEQVKLLVYDGAVAGVHKSFPNSGTLHVPPILESGLLRAVGLPTRFEPCGDPQALGRGVQECVRRYVDLSEEAAYAVSAFVFHTWLFDCSPVAVYLWVSGPLTSGKSTLLRLLAALCRRGVLAGDLSPGAIYRLSSTISPTLLIDEFDPGRDGRSRELLGLLRMGNTPGVHVARANGVYEAFGPKVICSRFAPPDAALASRCLNIPMWPSGNGIRALDQAALAEIKNENQAQLLGFRLQYYRRPLKTFFPQLADLSPRIRQIGQALLATFPGDQVAEDGIHRLLREHDGEAKLRRRGEPEWAVGCGLLWDVHRTETITMGSLAATANDLLASAGESYTLTPRRVGEIVRNLGLSTEQLGNRGRGLRLTMATKEKVHQLARRLGLRATDFISWDDEEARWGGRACGLCDESGLMGEFDCFQQDSEQANAEFYRLRSGLGVGCPRK
jgi:hypothetical protein